MWTFSLVLTWSSFRGVFIVGPMGPYHEKQVKRKIFLKKLIKVFFCRTPFLPFACAPRTLLMGWKVKIHRWGSYVHCMRWTMSSKSAPSQNLTLTPYALTSAPLLGSILTDPGSVLETTTSMCSRPHFIQEHLILSGSTRENSRRPLRQRVWPVSS